MVDGRGAVTAVGLGQKLLRPTGLPVKVRRSLVVELGFDSPDTPPTLSLAMKVTDPDGVTITAETAEFLLQMSAPTPEASTILLADLAFTAARYGKYAFELTASAPGHPNALADTMIYVLRREDSPDSAGVRQASSTGV